MSVNWLILLPAVVLLWTPIALLQGKKARHRVVDIGWHGYWPRTLFFGLHWLDLVRAGVGSGLLYAATAVDLISAGFNAHPPLLLRAGVLLVGALLQCRSREPKTIHAPFAYLAGLALGGLYPTVAVFSLALTLVLAIGPGLPSAFFPLLALIGAGLGFLLESRTGLFDAATLAPAVVAPWLLTLLLGKPFSSTYRARSRIEITSPLK
ncbi:MAG: hypothetical protein FJ397_13140 [Verrucomicrobia bacterium]|nr:hypothetical protein [Verrucomicrobiota bacterium]